MKVLFALSVFFLMVSFLFYQTKSEKVSIIRSMIHVFCFFFCYQTFVVCLLSYFHLGGSLLYYSIFHLLVGCFLDFVSFKRKKVQKFYFDKKEFLVCLLIVAVCFLVVLYRFRGFSSISYASDDPAIHYRAALKYSQVLEKLTIANSKEMVYGNFGGMMPISYVNCGMLIHLFSQVSSYRVFLMYDGLCFIMCTLLFYSTLFYIFKEKNYLYFFVITLLYGLGFPLNNLVFGFCYLGFGVMVIHLILNMILYYGEDMESDLVFKISVLFILSFSVFFSYYLFMPFIYLALGIYFILLYKRKKISFLSMGLYGVICLIIPFIIGFVTYFLHFFQSVSNVLSAISLEGSIYHNVTPIIFFFFMCYCFGFSFFGKKDRKSDFFYFSFIVLSGYVLLFFILFLCRIVGFYYFYKLFYIYWVYGILFLSIFLLKKKMILYGFFCFVILGSIYISIGANNRVIRFLSQLNVYYYNAINFKDDFIRLRKGDLELIDKAYLNKDICSYHDEFITIGYYSKNAWFYSIVGSIPVYHHEDYEHDMLYQNSIFFSQWENLEDYPCVVYFNEVKTLDYDASLYDVIYENDRGVLLRKRIE